MTQNVNDASVGQPAQENDETICVSATVFDPGKDDHPAPQPTAASMVSRDDPQVHNQAELESDGAARGAADNVVPSAGKIPSHPFAEIFPLLGEEALRELARDIAERELIDPIVRYEGKILDGRCRYRACLMVGVKSRFEDYNGADPVGYVLSRNIQRRHLIKEGQRAIVAARIASLKPGSNQHSEGLPIGRASKFLNVGSRSVARAREVLDHGVAELVQAVEEGKLAVSAAAQISRLPEPQQHEAIKHDRTGSPARTVIASAPALAPGEAEVAASDPADGFDVTGAAKVDTAEAGQAPAASAGETTTASVMESSRATARSQSGDRWLWPGYIPTPGVTVIVGSFNAPTTLVAIKVAAIVSTGSAWPDYRYATRGDVLWLTAQRDLTVGLSGKLRAAGAALETVRILEPECDNFGLPILHLHRHVHWVEGKLSGTHKATVAVIDYLSSYLAEDVDQPIRGVRGALSGLKDFAAKFGIAVILPCRLPCRGGSSVMTRAIDAFSVVPELEQVLVVEGTNRGTVVPKKTWTGVDANAVAFRTSTKPGVLHPIGAVVWENSIAMKSAARHEPYTTEPLSNREIANTSNPDVSHESSSPGVVPAQSDEIPATPSGPSTPPGMASANSIEGAAATRGTIHQRLRPGASANVGKPVLALNKPLARKPTVPVTPLHPQPAPGASSTLQFGRRG